MATAQLDVMAPPMLLSKAGATSSVWLGNPPVPTKRRGPRVEGLTLDLTKLDHEDNVAVFDTERGRDQAISSSPRGVIKVSHAIAVQALGNQLYAGHSSGHEQGMQRVLSAHGDHTATLTMQQSLERDEANQQRESAREKRTAANTVQQEKHDGTWAFKACGRDVRTADPPPPVGHYRPRDTLLQRRPVSAAFGQRRRTRTRVPPETIEQRAAREDEMTRSFEEKVQKAPKIQERFKREHLETAPFRSKVQLHQLRLPQAPDVTYDVAETLVTKRVVSLVDMARDAKKLDSGLFEPRPIIDAFYNLPAQKPPSGVLNFGNQTARASMAAHPVDRYYDVKEEERPKTADFNKMVTRAQREKAMAVRTSAATDIFYNVIDDQMKKHTPIVELDKLTGRPKDVVPPTVDKFYEPNVEYVKPRMREQPRFEDGVRHPTLALEAETHDLTYDPKMTLLEKHVPAVNMAAQVARDETAVARQSLATTVDKVYAVKLDAIQFQHPRPPSFEKTQGRDWDKFHKLDTPKESEVEREARLTGARKPKIEIRPLPKFPDPHVGGPAFEYAVPRSAFYRVERSNLTPIDPKWQVVHARPPAFEFAKPRVRLREKGTPGKKGKPAIASGQQALADVFKPRVSFAKEG